MGTACLCSYACSAVCRANRDSACRELGLQRYACDEAGTLGVERTNKLSIRIQQHQS